MKPLVHRDEQSHPGESSAAETERSLYAYWPSHLDMDTRGAGQVTG